MNRKNRAKQNKIQTKKSAILSGCCFFSPQFFHPSPLLCGVLIIILLPYRIVFESSLFAVAVAVAFRLFVALLFQFVYQFALNWLQVSFIQYTIWTPFQLSGCLCFCLHGVRLQSRRKRGRDILLILSDEVWNCTPLGIRYVCVYIFVLSAISTADTVYRDHPPSTEKKPAYYKLSKEIRVQKKEKKEKQQ